MARNTTTPATSRGGLAVVARKGTAYMRAIGARGGQTTVTRYGSEYMSALASLSAHARYGNLSKTALLRTERTVRRILSNG